MSEPEPNLDRWARGVVEQSKGSIWAGLGLTLLFHFVVLVSLLFILGTIVSGERGLELGILPVMYIGLSQLVYMIPAIWIARRKGETETSQGFDHRRLDYLLIEHRLQWVGVFQPVRRCRNERGPTAAY